MTIFQKPSYREIRPMRGRPMRGPPVPILYTYITVYYCFLMLYYMSMPGGTVFLYF